MAVDLFVQDDNNFILDVPADDSDLYVGQPVVTQIEKNYEELDNKPSLNNVELVGNKSFEDLGLVPATSEHDGLMSAEDKTALDAIPSELQDIREDIPTNTSELLNDSGFITDAGVTSFNGQQGDVIYTAPVQSVNGKTGTVSLSASDVGALPDSTPIPAKTSDLENDSGFVNASEAANAAPVQSVNGQTGTVTLDASDVGALPDTTPIPTKTSDLNNDSGFVNAAQAANAAPVQSVNGNTGSVALTASDVGALPDTTPIPTKTSDLTNDSGFLTLGTLPIWNGGVV